MTQQHLINKEIRGTEVRVSDVGILSLTEALRLAESDGLDLVLINPNAQPPVVKIMNYEKFLYDQSKKDKPKVLEMKEIKVGPNTSENDLTYRIKQISEFLGKGHRIKLSMQFKGREMIFVDKGMALILKLILDLENFGIAEAMPKVEGKKIIAYLKPLTKK